MRFYALFACLAGVVVAACSGTGQYGYDLDASDGDAGLPTGDAGPDSGLADGAVDASPNDDGGKVEVTADAILAERMRCPSILGIDALPASTSVGGSVALTAWVSNGTRLVDWSGDGGTFSANGASKTKFTCVAPGTHELQAIPVHDAGCQDAPESVSIECSP